MLVAPLLGLLQDGLDLAVLLVLLLAPFAFAVVLAVVLLVVLLLAALLLVLLLLAVVLVLLGVVLLGLGVLVGVVLLRLLLVLLALSAAAVLRQELEYLADDAEGLLLGRWEQVFAALELKLLEAGGEVGYLRPAPMRGTSPGRRA